mmetsp:Transcript_29835/g.48085  ORF Transcript_29835/g.48085 Transcript_29835/m.48085 type:complete len:250 (+) Transcript_29835:672-1421(+)
MGRGKMADHHLEKRLVGREPRLHDAFHEGLGTELEVVLLHGDVERGEHLLELVHLVVHAALNDLTNGVKDEHVESAVRGLRLTGPLLLGSNEIVLTPQTLSHLVDRDAELLGVNASKLGDGEGPAVKTSRKGNSALFRVNLKIFAHGRIVVGRNGHVHVLNVLREVRVHRLRIELELEETTVKLVDGKHGLNTLGKRLAKHSLGLHRHTIDRVHNHERTVCNTQGGSDLGGEVNVTRRVDEIDEKLTSL